MKLLLILCLMITVPAVSQDSTYAIHLVESYDIKPDSTGWLFNSKQQAHGSVDFYKKDSTFRIGKYELIVVTRASKFDYPVYFCYDPQLDETCTLSIRRDMIVVLTKGTKTIYYRLTSPD